MIQVKELSKIYNKIKVVDNLSLNIDKGKVACLIGTSGSGKTTALKMINRLILPDNGDVFINGTNTSSVSAIQLRRQMGYVIQKSGLLPHLNVKKNISLLSDVLKRDKKFIEERVRELMSMFNMPYEQFAQRFPRELSGGQQQRIGMARALMEDPPILLMDEPFSALDPITRKSIYKEFLQIKNQLNKTILMVTHNIREAFMLADIIYIMDNGKLIQSGTKTEILERPKNNFIKEFINDEY